MTLDHEPGRAGPGAPAARPAPPPAPDPEVPAQAQRRQFSAAYKLRILHEAATCPVGALGASSCASGAGAGRPRRPRRRSWPGCAGRTSG